jgi:hypothetical protein
MGVPLWSQISSINGEIRYQHQFQDSRTAASYSKLLRKNPQLTLGTTGFLYAPSILSFNLQSTLNLYYNTVTAGGFSTSYKQSLFNYYNLGIDALQNSKVRVSFNARDLAVESSSGKRLASEGLSNLRQQEQRLTLSMSNIKFLPTTILYFSRTHNYSDLATQNINQRQNEFSINLSQATQDGIYNMTGMINENVDNISGRRFSYSRFQFNGSKEFSPLHRVDINTEYSNYSSVSYLSGNGIYNGSAGEKFRLSTTLQGRNTLSSMMSSTIIGAGQVVQYRQNENFQYSCNFQNQYGNDMFLSDSISNKTFTNIWNTSASVQHTRPIGKFTITNDLNFGYGQQRSNVEQNSATIGINNSLQTAISTFQLIGNQGITFTRVSRYTPRDEINNFVNANITGMLPYGITTQTGIDFRNERRFRTLEYRYSRQTLTFNELMSASFYYHIPFTILLGTTFNWMWNDINGYSYGVNGMFSSNHLFLDGLAMSYRFNRMYDIYYQRPNFEHTVELSYQWRSLYFQVRLQEFRFVDVRHDLWFIVTRPINIGL